MPSDKTYTHRMPKYKRPFTYNSLLMFRSPVVQQIATDWYGIDVTDKIKARLIEEIMLEQEEAFRVGYIHA